jgi:hypothetical protein
MCLHTYFAYFCIDVYIYMYTHVYVYTYNLGVTSNSLHPGLVTTGLQRRVPQSIAYMWIIPQMYELILTFLSSIELNVDDGALTQLYAVTSPKMSGVTGQYLVPVGRRGWLSGHSVNTTLQRLLWEESERLTDPYAL